MDFEAFAGSPRAGASRPACGSGSSLPAAPGLGPLRLARAGWDGRTRRLAPRCRGGASQGAGPSWAGLPAAGEWTPGPAPAPLFGLFCSLPRLRVPRCRTRRLESEIEGLAQKFIGAGVRRRRGRRRAFSPGEGEGRHECTSVGRRRALAPPPSPSPSGAGVSSHGAAFGGRDTLGLPPVALQGPVSHRVFRPGIEPPVR